MQRSEQSTGWRPCRPSNPHRVRPKALTQRRHAVCGVKQLAQTDDGLRCEPSLSNDLDWAELNLRRALSVRIPDFPI